MGSLGVPSKYLARCVSVFQLDISMLDFLLLCTRCLVCVLLGNSWLHYHEIWWLHTVTLRIVFNIFSLRFLVSPAPQSKVKRGTDSTARLRGGWILIENCSRSTHCTTCQICAKRSGSTWLLSQNGYRGTLLASTSSVTVHFVDGPCSGPRSWSS